MVMAFSLLTSVAGYPADTEWKNRLASYEAIPRRRGETSIVVEPPRFSAGSNGIVRLPEVMSTEIPKRSGIGGY
jgi:hypothetical protein